MVFQMYRYRQLQLPVHYSFHHAFAFPLTKLSHLLQYIISRHTLLIPLLNRLNLLAPTTIITPSVLTQSSAPNLVRLGSLTSSFLYPPIVFRINQQDLKASSK